MLAEWENGSYSVTWLRRINRETKTQYISDVQRYVRSWDDDKKDRMTFIGKWAKRFQKTKDGVGHIKTRQSNPNGTMRLSLVEDPSTLKCKLTFKELFQTDIREIQNAGDYPLDELVVEAEDKRKDGLIVPDDFFLLERKLHFQSGEEESFGGWDNQIIQYLQKEFKAPVYRLRPIMNENNRSSKLSQSCTYMQITHFGNDKPVISRKENYHNRTILFWLFDDKLIFQYADGIGTW